MNVGKIVGRKFLFDEQGVEKKGLTPSGFVTRDASFSV